MAVNLDFGQSIIQAYAQGRKESLDREELKKRVEQQKIENEQKEEQIKAQKEQFAENQKREKAQYDAEHELHKSAFQLQQVLALPDFQKLAENSGEIPGATKSPYINQDGTVDQTKNTFQLPQALGGYNINARTQEQTAQDEAHKADLLIDPQIRKIEAQQKAEAARQKQIQDDKIASDNVQKQLDRDSREKIADANRRAATERARIRGVGDKTLTIAGGISKQWQDAPIVKNYNLVKSGMDYANNLDMNKGTGPSDLGLIIAYAKVKDPESVVRESEAEVAAKYAQTLADRFKFNISRINGSSEFLSPEARIALKNDILATFKTKGKEYTNLRDGFDKRLQVLKIDPEERALMLIDYTKGFGTAQIKVKRKSDGVVGMLDPGDFNAATYEKVD